MILEDRERDQRSLSGWQALGAFFSRVWFERVRERSGCEAFFPDALGEETL